MSLLLLEVRNCVRRKEFRLIFTILMLFSLVGFVVTCQRFWGDNLTFVRSAWDNSMIQGVYAHVWLNIELLMLPLFAAMIYSDSFYSDLKAGIYKSILTRKSQTSVILAKATVVFLITFLTVFVPLFINQLLCMIAFPFKGFDNNYSLPPYDIGFQNYTPNALLDLVRVQSPLLYNLISMAIISLFAALFALLAFGAYFITKKGKFATVTGVFLMYTGLEVGFEFLHVQNDSVIQQMSPGSTASVSSLVSWIALLASAAVLFIRVGLHRESGMEK